MNRDLLQIGEWFSWPGRSTHSIRTWRRFRRDVRNNNQALLRCLGEFEDPILVSGCQRSGTTALARAIAQSDGMTSYCLGRDDELDAAMILAGCVPLERRGRYCFQTTYVNECYPEYLDYLDRFRMIWVLRNPHSVVYSMLHNWGRFAFDELFRYCGVDGLDVRERKRFERFGALAIPRIRQGCLSYNAKVAQVFTLHEVLGPGNLLVLDYDELVSRPAEILPVVYRFLGLEYQTSYDALFTARSVTKADRFPLHERQTVTSLCESVFRRAQTLFSQDRRSLRNSSDLEISSETGFG